MYKVMGGDQVEYGPATGAEVQEWIAEGRLSGQSLARLEESQEWRELSTFTEFSASLRAQAAQFLATTATSLGVDEPLMGGSSEPRGRVAYCLRRSGELMLANFGILVPAAALVWLLSMVCQLIPVIGGLLYMALHGVLIGGLYVVYLRRVRGEPASIGEVFSGFSDNFSQLMLVGFVTALLSSIGMLFCAIPWVYLQVAWVFAIPLVADQRMEFWSAMERSRRKVNKVFFPMLGLLVAALLPLILMQLVTQIQIFSHAYPALRDMMASGQPDFNKWFELLGEVARQSMPLVYLNKLVLLLNLPFAIGTIVCAYEDLFGDGSE